MTEVLPSRPIKLSCQNLWKIYGTQANLRTLAENASADRRTEICERLRADGHLPAVIDANFDIHAGEIFVIMGLSGSGKSTLVRCLSRLVDPTAGKVLLDGEDMLAASPTRLIELRRKEMGMVFQHFGLLPHLTVLDNVAFPLRVQGQSIKERHRRAVEMIALVGLEGRESAYPHQLSGGQQQRVGLARSLAVGPTLWFLDEPFSALDPLIRRQMQDEFLRLQRVLGKTIVFITHDMQEAFRLADRIAIMRQGEIIQIGKSVDIVRDPADDYVARFVEDIPLVRVVQAKDLLQPDERSKSDAMDIVSPSTTVEDLLAKLARGAKSFSVVDDAGAKLGGVDAPAVLSVVDRDRQRRR